jgi:hypothetical protein
MKFEMAGLAKPRTALAKSVSSLSTRTFEDFGRDMLVSTSNAALGRPLMSVIRPVDRLAS